MRVDSIQTSFGRMKMNRAEFKALAENNKHGFIDMGDFPLIEISDENMRLLKNKYPLAFGFLKEFGCAVIVKKIDANMHQYFSINDRFTEEDIISDLAIKVAKLDCGAQSKNVIYSNERHCFQFEDGQIIADNVEALFDYMLSDKSILPVKIFTETFEKLKQCGWYENRCIDIGEIANKFESDGTSLSEKQKQFLREFGGIKGIDANDEGFIIYDSIRMLKCGRDNIVYFKPKAPSEKDMHSYGSRNIVAYNNDIDMLRIGEKGYGIMPIWISTDGKLFRDDGAQLGRNAIEGIQTLLLGQ